MKTKNIKKVVVSTMALAMGAALAGSISGTVAWYQYSTRATAAFVGSSAHCTHSLQVSKTAMDNDWHTDMLSADIIAAATAHNGSKFSPVTPGAANDGTEVLASTMYGNPSYKYFEYSKWAQADDNAYLQFSLYFRVLDINGSTSVTNLAKDLYLTDLTIEGDGTADEVGDEAKFIDAIRIHITDGSTSLLLSKNGATDTLGAKLDLNNDGEEDKPIRYADWETAEAKEYGDSSLKQISKPVADYLADDTGAELDVTGATKIARTNNLLADNSLKLTFTIWLEGWAGTNIWDVADYTGNFHIGMSFGVESHEFH